ncbi:MAG: hypothetical protein Q9212_001408 [Teloschistes hypoglaucus]
MSHYINSFLIEPVVRQARGFSRPSLESLPSHSVNHPLSSPESLGETSTERPGLENTTLPSIVGHHGPSLATSVAAELNDITLHLENDTLEVESHSEPLREDSESPWEEVSIDRAPPSAESIDEHMSNNPGHGVTESLRSGSTTSSVSAHAQRDRDADNMDTVGMVNPRRHDSHGANRGNNVTSKERILPADDGMGLMRKRIVAIQRTNSSNAEKAKLVHGLMTEQYNSSQPSLHPSHPSRPRSPASLASYERPITPGSLQSLERATQCTSPPTSLSSVTEAFDPFRLSPKDLEPTFWRQQKQISVVAGSENRSSDSSLENLNEDLKPLGCLHYKRNIKLQCSACYRWYTCRFCHDAAEDHSLNRRATKNMLCMLCGCAQVASERCTRCGERSARYYCSICKLWDDDATRSIYHCNDCGICRVGQGLGKDFFHCQVRLAIRWANILQ